MRSSVQVSVIVVEAAPVVLPQAFVRKIVEVEIFQVPELGARRREQLLADLHVRIHRAADVEQQQQLDGVAPLRLHAQVEDAAVARGGADGAVEIEFLGRTLARETAQPPQRHLDIARAELARRVEIAIFARLPHLDARAPGATPDWPMRTPSGL